MFDFSEDIFYLISANLDDVARRAIQVGRGDIEVDKMQLA